MASFPQRDYTPPPLAYPYKPFPGVIPQVVLDRLGFSAFNACASGVDLGVFMIRAWEDFRFPHAKMLQALLDHGLVRRAVDAIYGDSWAWVAVESATRRSEVSSDAKEQTFITPEIGFFDVDLSQPLISSVVVAPKISPMGWTTP